MGFKEQREKENKNKVTHESVERNTRNKRRESLTQMKKEGKIAR